MKQMRHGRLLPGLVIVLLVVIVLYIIPLPYYISEPGSAIQLSTIIEVEERHPGEGTLMLTSIHYPSSNVINYLLAKMDDYKEIIPKEVMLAHYNDEQEYAERQIQMMQSSQENAILVAYRLADKEVKVLNEGVMVVQTIEEMPAEEHLVAGDIITHVDGDRVLTSEELISLLQGKEKDEQVELIVSHQDEEKTIQLRLAEFPLTEEEKAEGIPPRAGIGISTITKRTLEVHPPVQFHTKRIGGPSAGLMFALEIYNQLTDEDVTKGYDVAGTGTINPEGEVGRIGGVQQKVVAADQAGADIFFAPYEQGAATSNYQQALEAAQDIGTTMEIVPVETIDDALAYLQDLPGK